MLFLFSGQAAAQPIPAAPPPPAKYKVLLRYRIPAPRDQHVMQYDSLVEHLKALAFDFNPPLDQRPNTDREDRSKNLMEGQVLPANLLPLLRHPNVASILAMPDNFMLPAQPDQPVSLRLELASGLAQARQRELANQVRASLGELGFREAIAYDHRGHSRRPFTRLVGTMPAGNIELLLKDLRDQPLGWYVTPIPREDIPTPLRLVNPIRLTEVLLDPEPPKDPEAPQAREKDYLHKISPDLWDLVNQKGQENKVVHLELFLAEAPAAGDATWRQTLQRSAPDLLIDSQQGELVGGRGPVGQVPLLAALPQVSVIRLAPGPLVQVDPALKMETDNSRALAESRLADWHEKKYRGQKVTLAIVDTDFRLYQEMWQKKRLPAKTRLVDLTTLHNPAIVPRPFAGDPKQMGHGTHCALAAALAAPEAELVLIRLEGARLLQLEQVIRYMRGDFFTEELERRQGELHTAQAILRNQREELLRERRVILEDFTDETDLLLDFEFLGAVRGWIFSRREWHQQRMAYQEKEEQLLRQRQERFRQLLADLRSLEKITLVACPLVWGDGYALGGANPLSRWLNRQGGAGPIWFQAVGNFQGQSWTGLFRDADGNGVMEFADASPLPKGSWTPELNFLGWQPFEAAQELDLPAQAKVRLALQWQEAHDADFFFRLGEPDWYRQPLADLRLVLLRQRDPHGKTVAADAFEEVARSAGWPQRLDNQPSGSTYEQALEVSLEKAGRYAVRIESQLPTRWLLKTTPDRSFWQLQEIEIPTGLRPRGTATLPALEKKYELKPRLFVQVVDEATTVLGRPVFLSFATSQGTTGMPADARSLVSVGAAGWDGKARPFSALGPPAFLELDRRPTILAFDRVGLNLEEKGPAYGTSLATAFAAGMAATYLSSEAATAKDLETWLKQQNSQLWRLPEIK